MLQQLMEMVKNQVGGQLQNEHNLDNTQINEVMNHTQSSLFENLKNQAMSGDFSNMMSLFNGQDSGGNLSQNMMQQVSSTLLNTITSKMNLNSSSGGSIVQTIMNSVMKNFSSSETGTADNPMQLMNMFGLDSDSGVSSMLQNFMGGDAGDLLKKIF